MSLLPDLSVPLPLDADLTATTVPYQSSQTEVVFRNSFCPDRLVSHVTPQLRTYHELFSDAARRFASRPCLSYREYDYDAAKFDDEYRSLSYLEVDELRTSVGSGILAALAKVDPASVTRHLAEYKAYNAQNMSPIVCIFSANRYEWTLCDVACHGFSLTNTALYDNLGDNVTVHILKQTESPFVFCSEDKVEKVCRLTAEHNLKVKVVVSLDRVTAEMRAQAEKTGLALYTLKELAELGRAAAYDFCPPSQDTLFTISFTSGTTGANPKGVMLSHRNASSAITFLMAEIAQVENGRACIFLPLTHIFERQTSSFALMTGYNLGYPRITHLVENPDPFQNLIADLKVFKPHYFSIVPRLLTKFESYIKSHVASQQCSKRLEEIIERRTKQQCSADFCEGDPVDFPAYKELRSLVGFDNLLWTQTASAPVNKFTLMYLKAALGIGISQLYGLTETFGAMTRGLLYEAEPGSCGSIGMTIELKLQERADMGYLLKDQKGELMMRGPQVCEGYYKNDEETKKAFDEHGWFYSGDVGQIKGGKVYIVDRVKNFFKLAHGEYISPERIENIYLSKVPVLQQLFVYGHPSRYFVVGIAGVTMATGQQILEREVADADELLAQLNAPDVKAAVLQKFNSTVAGYLNGMERMGNIHFQINPLTVERNVVTPTMKLKRALAAKYFDKILTHMYEEEGSLTRKGKM